VPAEVRQSDIDQVRASARLFTNWDHTYGGGVVREAVTAQLRWPAELLEAKCPKGMKAGLFTAVGALSGVCGFMAFDAYAHDDARRMFTFGLTCAEKADDWHLRAKLLSNLARQAVWCGDRDTGLTHSALVRADRLTDTELAMLHTARARALGKLGQTRETFAAGTPCSTSPSTTCRVPRRPSDCRRRSKVTPTPMPGPAQSPARSWPPYSWRPATLARPAPPASARSTTPAGCGPGAPPTTRDALPATTHACQKSTAIPA
jgi:hypothetical protein